MALSFTLCRVYLRFIRYSHYDGPTYGDGNKKPPEGGHLNQTQLSQ